MHYAVSGSLLLVGYLLNHKLAAKVTQSTVAVVGGDNQAESQFAAAKRVLRKQNLLARTSPRDINCCVFAA